MIPGARFVPLGGREPVLLENDAAWQRCMAEVRDLLGAAPAPAAHGAPGVDDAMAEPALTAAERDVLRLVAQGLVNGAIARQLHKSETALARSLPAELSRNRKSCGIPVAREVAQMRHRQRRGGQRAG